MVDFPNADQNRTTCWTGGTRTCTHFPGSSRRNSGRTQLIVYHFLFGPDAEAGCPGCSWVTDAMSHPAHLHARNTSLVLISRASIEKLVAFRARMGWDVPWYSSLHSDFNYDFNATKARGENHVTSVFLRDGNDIYRTYYTDQRGVE